MTASRCISAVWVGKKNPNLPTNFFQTFLNSKHDLFSLLLLFCRLDSPIRGEQKTLDIRKDPVQFSYHIIFLVLTFPFISLEMARWKHLLGPTGL